jgi:hypothetical protein
MSDGAKRAIIEYKVTPFGEKPKAKVFQRVIENAASAQDAERQFWRVPIWPRWTKAVSINSITWPDEEQA